MADGGANRTITNDITVLCNLQAIKPFTIGGIKEGEGITCIAVGEYCITCDNGIHIFKLSDSSVMLYRLEIIIRNKSSSQFLFI